MSVIIGPWMGLGPERDWRCHHSTGARCRDCGVCMICFCDCVDYDPDDDECPCWPDCLEYRE